jgi:hypothetical protein
MTACFGHALPSSGHKLFFKLIILKRKHGLKTNHMHRIANNTVGMYQLLRFVFLCKINFLRKLQSYLIFTVYLLSYLFLFNLFILHL